MPSVDPKRYMKTQPNDDDESTGEDLATQLQVLQAQVQTLLAMQSGGISEERLERILSRVAQMSADAQERAVNPSNKTHPGISVYSYPEGDRARPRPDLKCKMFWCGYPIDKDTSTAEEIELLNQAVPGKFSFKRTDRTTDDLTVTGESDAAGNLSRLLFTFEAKERRDSLPPMSDLLRSAYGIKSAEEIELEALRAEVARLKQQPVTA